MAKEPLGMKVRRVMAAYGGVNGESVRKDEEEEADEKPSG